MKKTNSKWAKTLEPEQFLIMREEGTEMPGSSDLNDDAFLASLVHPKTSLSSYKCGHVGCHVHHLTINMLGRLQCKNHSARRLVIYL